MIALMCCMWLGSVSAMDNPAKIAYLSWGSLAANPGSLPLVEPQGFLSNPRTGPALRVDYARKSNDGRLTLVISPGFGKIGDQAVVHELKTLYATYRGDNVSQARAALQAREGTAAENIGYVDLREGTYRRKDYDATTGRTELKKGRIGDTYYRTNEMLQRIVAWAENTGYTAVIWTDLPPSFKKGQLTLTALKTHLDTLDKAALIKAYCYFKITPEEIRRGTRFGEPLRAYTADRLRNFFEESVDQFTPSKCIDLIYTTR